MLLLAQKFGTVQFIVWMAWGFNMRTYAEYPKKSSSSQVKCRILSATQMLLYNCKFREHVQAKAIPGKSQSKVSRTEFGNRFLRSVQAIRTSDRTQCTPPFKVQHASTMLTMLKKSTHQPSTGCGPS